MKCPKCRSELAPIRLGHVNFEFCVSCRGLWFASDAAVFVAELSKDIPNSSHSLTDNAPTGYACPQCRYKMDELNFDSPVGVSLDRCRACRGVWLDRGEINKITEISAGFDRPRSKIIRVARHARM